MSIGLYVLTFSILLVIFKDSSTVWIYPFLKNAAQNLEHEKSGQTIFEADQIIISKGLSVK
jgi:hypothetical protein